MLAPARDEPSTLLGRSQEQQVLSALLDGVVASGRALVLRGEPGIGKSRILEETARGARERGMTVLTTTGVQSEAHLPFANLHQLLRPVRDHASELRDPQRGALDAAFGLTREAAPEHFRIRCRALHVAHRGRRASGGGRRPRPARRPSLARDPARAGDLAAPDAAFMADSQVPWGVEALGGTVTEPAWRSMPSWYLISTDDRMIDPRLQHTMSSRAGASVVEAAGSHSIYVSQPRVTADLIEQAAREALARTPQTV